MVNIKSLFTSKESILPNLIEWINLLAAIYLACTLLFPFEIQKPAYYCYFISLGLDIIINKRYSGVKWYKAKWVFVAMVLFYLCIWIWLIIDPKVTNHFKLECETRLPLIVFGILGIFTHLNPKIKIKYIAIAISMTSIIATIFIIYLMNLYNEFEFDYIQFQNSFAKYRIYYVASHIKFNYITNLAIVLCFFSFIKSKRHFSKIFFFINILLCNSIVLLSEGRTGFFTSLVLITFISFYLIKQFNKNLILPFIIIAVVILFATTINHAKIKDRNIFNDPRSYIWEHAVYLIKDKPITGYGVSSARDIYLTTKDNNPKLNVFLKNWCKKNPEYNINLFHTHNIFLESALEFGIIGVILTILIMILPIIFTKKELQITICLIIFVFYMEGMFETPGTHLTIFPFYWLIYILLNKNYSISN